jgi:transaldolase
VMASQKAKRLEEELNRYRNQEAETQKRSEEARKIESLMGEVTKVMQEIKIPLTEDNKDLAIEALEKLRLLREQGKNPSVKDLVAWVNAKRNKESVERDQKYTESINTLPDEVLKQRHGSLIERLRKLDLAEINKGRSTAKTSQPKEGTEPEKSPRSKQKVLNSVEWDKYWR